LVINGKVFVVVFLLPVSLGYAQCVEGDWDAGDLVHLIPMANHERFLIKTLFRSPLEKAP